MGLRIAQLRMVPIKGDLAANGAMLMAALAELAPRHVDVVVTPECFTDGYVSTEDHVTAESLRHYAIDPAASPLVEDVEAWARTNRAWVILGCSRLAPDGIRNSALIVNRHGTRVGWYDKTHCQAHDRKYVAGQTLAAFDGDFGRFGVLICADRRWPEAVRTLALQGARIIFNPTYGLHDAFNTNLMRTRSYESEVAIAFTHPRLSLLTGPAGNVLGEDADAGTRFSIREIDLDEVDRIRAGPTSHLKDRRPDLYAR